MSKKTKPEARALFRIFGGIWPIAPTSVVIHYNGEDVSYDDFMSVDRISNKKPVMLTTQ